MRKRFLSPLLQFTLKHYFGVNLDSSVVERFTIIDQVKKLKRRMEFSLQIPASDIYLISDEILDRGGL